MVKRNFWGFMIKILQNRSSVLYIDRNEGERRSDFYLDTSDFTWNSWIGKSHGVTVTTPSADYRVRMAANEL